MNVTNLKKTRDHIAAHPDDYYQMRYRNPCGTPACVAGYAVVACGGTLTRCCLLYTSPSPRDRTRSRMPSSA